ncbi:MAG: hypothetical protein B5M55_07265 [Desulfococcus sp. 4484_242]|nr:MAG: hypothetical protein B5M55_07265 [Desulfococcus sp. 4484_242]
MSDLIQDFHSGVDPNTSKRADKCRETPVSIKFRFANRIKIFRILGKQISDSGSPGRVVSGGYGRVKSPPSPFRSSRYGDFG